MKKSIFDFFKSENSDEKKVTFAEITTIDGIVLQYDGALDVNTPVFMVDADGNQIPASEGKYQVEFEGKIFVLEVDANGVVVSKEAVAEEEAEPMSEMMSKDEFNTIISKVIEDANERFTALENKLMEKFNELANAKESKFKDERKKVEMSSALSVREILTKK